MISPEGIVKLKLETKAIYHSTFLMLLKKMIGNLCLYWTGQLDDTNPMKAVSYIHGTKDFTGILLNNPLSK